MSFLDIKDPKKRDAIVSDYLATIRHIQQRNLDERTEDLTRAEHARNVFNPIVKSTEKATEQLTKKLEPMQQHLGEIKNKLSNLNEEIKEEEETTTLYDQINKKYDATKLDKYFGIERVGTNEYMMGDKPITIDEKSNIHVKGKKYKGTSGLWNLIMLNKPSENLYTFKDLDNYKELINQTDVANHPRNETKHSRPHTTFKWKNIISSLSVSGEGIHFLPGDIKGMKSKLNLLLSEYSAGNKTSTRNEIVPILDELLRRKKLSHREYTDINTYLSKCL